MSVGVAEDLVKSPDLVLTKSRSDGAAARGVRHRPRDDDLVPRSGRSVADRVDVAAERRRRRCTLAGMRVIVSVYAAGSRTTPLTRAGAIRVRAVHGLGRPRAPLLRDVIVGNEPNLNRFWLPQFNTDGSNAAAPAYLSLLAAGLRRRQGREPGGAGLGWRARRTRQRPTRHPARHALAGEVPPRSRCGVSRVRADDARHGRPRLPPVSGRLEPLPGGAAPELDDDRPRRLRPARHAARPGVRRDGATRVDAADPVRRVRDRVGDPGREVEGLHRRRADDDEADPGGRPGRFVRACAAARVLPAERRRGSCSSTRTTRPRSPAGNRGSSTADGTPKTSYVGVRDAVARTRGGSIGQCDGLSLPVRATAVRYPTASELARGRACVSFRCDLDCAFTARLLRGATVVRTVRSYARAGAPCTDRAGAARCPRRGYRVRLQFVHPLHPAAETVRESHADQRRLAATADTIRS